MAFLRIPNAGSKGVVRDLSEHELPAGVWTDCRNVRFFDGRAHQSPGHEAVFGETTVAPLHLVPIVIGTDRFWIYAGTNKVFAVAFDGSGVTGVHTNITRQSGSLLLQGDNITIQGDQIATALADDDYAGTFNGWTSTVLGGIPVLNAGNLVDTPQFWNLDVSDNLAEITAWPASTFCESMRSYKNYLVALNVTKGTAQFPFMVKWSSAAEPGTLPVTWDETDTTNDAGETDLAQGHDPIVDGLQLRDSFMIYKESSIWRMDFTGGPFVHKFSKVLGSSGAMNRNCIVEVDGFHFVLTSHDVILHDGNLGISVLDNITRRFLFDDINGAEINKTFVFKNPFSEEIFICYASGSSEFPDKAMTWNYQDKTVSFRDMPNVNHSANGALGTASQAWELDSQAWDSDTTTWAFSGQDITDRSKSLLASNDTQLFAMDASFEFDGLIPSALMERRGLSLGVDRDGNPVNSAESRTFIKNIRPRITGNVGQQITISVGFHDTDPYADPIYPAAGVMTHTIGTTVNNSCLVSGRYIAIKIETDSAFQWTLDSLDIEFEQEGMW